MPTYNKHYQEHGYFGDPYSELVTFFADYEPKGNVLDLGCGQGRDSISLARMGYTVTGVDISKVGVSQMMGIAEKEGLNVTGIIGDMYSYDIDESVDIVLLDSMLHFYKPDKERESNFVLRIMEDLKVGGLLCVVVWRSTDIERELKQVFERTTTEWKTLADNYIEYPDKQMEMRMIIQRKILPATADVQI